MQSTAFKSIAGIVALCLAGCSILQPVPGGETAWRHSVQMGDTVVIETTDGRTLEFEVSNINDNGLSGEGQVVSYAAIASLQKQTLSAWRTLGLVLGILAAGALAGGGGYDDGYNSGTGNGGSGGDPYTPP